MNPFKMTKEKLLDSYYKPPSLQANLITQASNIKSSRMNPSTNPFEALSDYPILHIFSFLSRDDLLKLTLMDKKFNRIITESRETMAKIPLVLNFRFIIAADKVMELVHKRRFRALRIKNYAYAHYHYPRYNEIIAEEYALLLEYLSGTVEHLEFDGSFGESQFHQLLQIFLPTLKTCEIAVIANAYLENTITSEKATSNHPLKSLRIDNCKSEMFKYFSGCKQLKSFEFLNINSRIDQLYKFLAQQTHLEKLKISQGYVDLREMIFVQLKELSLSTWISYDEYDDEYGVYFDESNFSEYLEQLPNLTKLRIALRDRRFLNRTMTTICNASKLEDLFVKIRCSTAYIPSDRLENHTVKKLGISHAGGEFTEWLLQTFRGVESVSLGLSQTGGHCNGARTHENYIPPEIKYHADLSSLPHEMIDRIQIEPAEKLFNIKFCPHLVPVHVQRFEAVVKKFAEKFSTRIESFTIGHNNWRNIGNFKLSNSFCEGLVQSLPNLTMLELYNIADRKGFISFLDDNRKNLENLTVKIHRPNDEDEPKSQKMRIETD